MKSSSQTNRFPIGSIVGEYDMKEKRYINHFFIYSYLEAQYKLFSIANHDRCYIDSLKNSTRYEYHLVSDGI
jgi:hypothetical protein